MFYALSQDKHDLNNKVNLFVALAPLVRMYQIGDLQLRTFAKLTSNQMIEDVFKKTDLW
jgi:hypothetical protein